MNRRTATIQDVARVAGVSTATVSRALSTPGVVAETTRKAVFAAVRETGYTVNQAARNLRQRRTGSVVALVPNIANPFFSRILSGVAATLSPAGYSLLIADTQSGPEAEARLMGYLDDRRADGLILFDGSVPRAHLARGQSARPLPPLVFACEWIGGLDVPGVRIDNAEGARLAVAHLAGLGHTRIGHLAGPPGNVLSISRAAGFAEALKAHGMEKREEWAFDGDFTLDSGAFAAQRWLELGDRPTAVFCASDEMACGFVGALQRHGVRVPEDVSVVGFDNIEIAGHVSPPLTTVRQPRTELGERAAAQLMSLMAGKTLEAREVVLPVELVERESTAPPASHAAGDAAS